MTRKYLIVQLSRTFVHPDNFAEVFATVCSGTYVGRTTADTPAAVAAARRLVDSWKLRTSGEYNWLHDRAAQDVAEYAEYGNPMHYAVLDVLTAHDPQSGLTAAYVVIKGDDTGIIGNNPVLYLSPETRCWEPIVSLDEDGFERTARQLALAAVGVPGAKKAFRKDFFTANMPAVTDVPDGFAANTTTAADPVFYMDTPRVGEDIIFDTATVKTTHTATVRNDL